MLKLNYPRLNHPFCKNKKCLICLNDHEHLGKYLDIRCNTKNKVDHLGKYLKWLSDNGISPETDWGWMVPEAFDNNNIENYIKWFKENYR